MSEEKKYSDLFLAVVTVFNIIRLLLDMQDRLLIINYSIPLVFLWLIMILTLLIPFEKSIEILNESVENLSNITKYFIVCMIILTTNYSFIIMGFYKSYYLALLLSVVTIIIFGVGFYFKKNIIKEIWKTRIGKITTFFSIVLCLILPSVLTLINPIINEPRLIVSSSEPEIFIKDIGDFQEVTIVVKNVRGYAWHVKINAMPVNFCYIYVDGIENGEKNIDYLPLRRREEFPLIVDTSYSAINGTYLLKILCEYSNAQGIKTIEQLNIPIYLGEKPLDAAFPSIWVGVALIVILAGVAYYYYTQKKGEDESFISFWSERGRV